MKRTFGLSLALILSIIQVFNLYAQQEKKIPAADASEFVSNDIQASDSAFNQNIDSILYQTNIYKEAYSRAKRANDFKNIIQSLVDLGAYYQEQFRYEVAMESYFGALEICDSLNLLYEKARVQHEIGSLYLEIRNLELAHEYLSYSLEGKKQHDIQKSVASTLNSLALTIWLQGKLDTALHYLFETLELEQQIDNLDGIARCYNNIGIVYHEMKKYDEALLYLNKSLEIKINTSDKWSIAETLNNIGENYISQGKYNDAIEVLTEAQSLAKEINALVLLSDNYRYFSRLYKRTQNFEKALNYRELFIALEDSLFNKDKLAIINELRSSFEIEKRENAIQLHRNRIELLEKKEKISRLQKFILIGFVGSILIIGVIYYNRQKKINERNRQLLEKDKQIQSAQAKLVENERKEKERLSEELHQKNKFLTDFALYIGMKNELLFSVKDKLKKLARKNRENTELRPIVYQLNQSLRHNNELIDFQENVEKVNVEFIQNLIKRYPDITENEKQLAIFLRLNISSKEIADFRAVSIKAVEMSRYRLRKKLNLGKNDSLSEFIQSI